MSAFATLTLADSTATPANFTPTVISSEGVAKWADSASVYDAKKTVTQQLSYPKNGGSVVRLKLKVMLPVMDSVDTTKKAGDGFCNIEFVLPKTMSSTARADLRALAKSLIGHANVIAAVDSFESVY